MSSLTEQERLGLEEVFLSISSHHRSGKRLALYGAGLWRLLREQPLRKGLYARFSTLFMVKNRLKRPKIRLLAPKRGKKKKNLS